MLRERSFSFRPSGLRPQVPHDLVKSRGSHKIDLSVIHDLENAIILGASSLLLVMIHDGVQPSLYRVGTHYQVIPDNHANGAADAG
jgi:hypothetical protein